MRLISRSSLFSESIVSLIVCSAVAVVCARSAVEANSAVETTSAVEANSAVETASAVETTSTVETNSAVETSSVVGANSAVETRVRVDILVTGKSFQQMNDRRMQVLRV